MKILSMVVIGAALLLSVIPAVAQVTNLTVNGSAVSFSMASGDAVLWEYDLPAGATATGEIWFDFNGNDVVDVGVDKPMFFFTQTDGDPNGNGGPPDMDGAVNGHIEFQQPVGLAPADYILTFSHNATGMTVLGTVTPLASPNGTISGTVTPPLGQDKHNILVEADQRSDTSNQSQGGDTFWAALTDSNGFYTIELNTDSSTTFWSVRVQDNFAPSIVTPDEVILTLTTSFTGVDFGYVAAAAQVTGHVFDDSHAPIANMDVFLQSDTGHTSRFTRTDGSGFFQIGLSAGDLNGEPWHVSTSQNGDYTSTFLQARADFPAVLSGDSLYRELTVYAVNSQIEGYVRINGLPPGYPMSIAAISPDTAVATAQSDGSTGRFVIPVSDRIASYDITSWSMPFNTTISPLSAQPGDTGLILSLTTLSVIERGPGMPSAFALRQNYPNPFNPATGIRYDLPSTAHVTLTVYDMLGREIAILMDGVQQAGTYTARFDASRLPSGVYFYRLSSGSNVATQKMILMK